MTIHRLRKHISTETTRHGKTVYYFRIGSGPRVRLPDEYGTPAFWSAYAAALAGAAEVRERKLSPAAIQRRHRIEDVLASAVNRAKAKSAEKGLPFDLSLRWALDAVEESAFRCPVTDIPLCVDNLSGSTIHPFNPSIDRVRPGAGYTMTNCRIVIFAVNMMLSDWGSEVFERVANGYRRTQRGNGEMPATTMAKIGRAAQRRQQ